MGRVNKSLRLLFQIFFLFILAHHINAQNLEIINSDALYMRTSDLGQYKVLSGHVHLKQKNLNIFCDSALIFEEKQNLKAIGHVFIEKEDTLKLYCDTASYDQKNDIVHFNNNVRLIQGNLNLSTGYLEYDNKNNCAKYFSRSTINRNENKIISNKGSYYTNNNRGIFTDSVILSSNNINIHTDTLILNKETQTYFFNGPTDITKDQSEAYCENGYYRKSTESSLLSKNAWIKEKDFFISADSIFINDKKDIAEANNNVLWMDSSEQTKIYCQYALYSDSGEQSLFSDEVLFLSINNQDSFYILGDTLRRNSIDSSLSFYPDAYIYNKANISRCDSLVYVKKEGLISMLGNPKINMDSTLLKADTIHLFLKEKNKLDKIIMKENSWIIDQTNQGLYNQIKGQNTNGCFKNDSLDWLMTYNNVESIYFAENEKKELIGLNQSTSDSMLIRFKGNSVKQVKFSGNPIADFKPFSPIETSTYLLKSFQYDDINDTTFKIRTSLYFLDSQTK